ncbi:hypothetical protein ACQKLX_03710 [Bosea sp. NPDC003192]|uniref:hypothetical protein n=1 Tax=Bosea sp. NPDC003192 TaxID=3390551 RepID=UPI003D0221B3
MLKGCGLLSLWNGVDPERRGEYDLWHTREHVPERLAIPGMLRARRYHRGEGPLPEFLTLYELENTGVLDSEPYRALLQNPTPWSRSMRPSFRGFFRVGHLIELSRGGGVGGALMATVFADAAAPAGRWEAVVELVLQKTAATAVHVLAKDPAVAPVPFSVPSGDGISHADGGALMVECYDRERLPEIAGVLDAALDTRGLARGREAWTSYDLAYVLGGDELASVVSLSTPPG